MTDKHLSAVLTISTSALTFDFDRKRTTTQLLIALTLYERKINALNFHLLNVLKPI